MNLRRFSCLFLVLCLLLPTVGCRAAKKDGVSPGDPIHFEVENVKFTMRYVPAAVFPTGVEDDGEAEVEDPFWLGETEVTYELWYEIRIWAEENGYRFAKQGSEGGRLGQTGQEPSKASQHPVTRINWFDAIIWCNALSEYLELTPLYLYEGEVYRNPRYREYEKIELAQGIGFRLPAFYEMELAARYKGSDRGHGAIDHPKGSGMYWTPGNYASGAKGPITDEKATMEAAWYDLNSEIKDGGLTTHPVGQKPSGGNSLNIYDMSGNVFEWLHDVETYTHRGGCYFRGPESLQVGYDDFSSPTSLGNSYPNLGFRLLLPGEYTADGDETEKPSESETVRETTTAQETTTDQDETTSSETEPALRYSVGSLVEVEWNSTWYLAKILEIDEDSYFITYIGYDESWDEWAEVARIRELSDPLVVDQIASIALAVDLNSSLTEDMLPAQVEITLKGNIKIEIDVNWNIAAFNSSVPGEFELPGQLVGLPESIANPDNISPYLFIRVRDEVGSQSRLRTGGRTDVDDLLFYIEHDEQITGYYFGDNSNLDISHVVIEENGDFASMIVYDESMLPIQWVFPELTISVVVPRNEFFDPSAASLMFILDDEQGDITLDITMNYSVEQLLLRMPQLFGNEFVEFALPLRQSLHELGWMDKTVSEVAELSETEYEKAIALMLSTLGTSMRIIDGLAELEADSDLASFNPGQSVTILGSGNDNSLSLQQVSVADLATKIAKKVTPSARGTCWSILKYLYKIATGHYDGQNIKGPAVSMLLCAGASTVPSVCNEFYIPNTPGNVSKCVSICVVTMSCFTEICHPMNFSAQDALGLRQPLKGP